MEDRRQHIEVMLAGHDLHPRNDGHRDAIIPRFLDKVDELLRVKKHLRDSIMRTVILLLLQDLKVKLDIR